jgi:hypothetical protein
MARLALLIFLSNLQVSAADISFDGYIKKESQGENSSVTGSLKNSAIVSSTPTYGVSNMKASHAVG